MQTPASDLPQTTLRRLTRVATAGGALISAVLALTFIGSEQLRSSNLSDDLASLALVLGIACLPFLLAWKLVDRKPDDRIYLLALLVAIAIAMVSAFVRYTAPDSPNGKDGLVLLTVPYMQAAIIGGTALGHQAFHWAVRRLR